MEEKEKQNVELTSEKKEKSKSSEKNKRKKIITIVIVLIVVLAVVGAGLGVYFFVLRGNKPNDVLNDYCSAYNKQDVAAIEKCIYGSFDSTEFQKVSSYSVNSFELKNENSNFAVGEAVMTYITKDGKTEKDTFTVYLKKDGRKWKLCSSIVFEDRSNTFVKIQ